MKTLENVKVIKETEKACLLKAFVTELDSEFEFWLPKSKFEEQGTSIVLEDDIWSDKLEELKAPQIIPAVIIYVDNFEEQGNSIKIILSGAFKNLNINPWFFIPKSLILEQGELDTDEQNKIFFKIPEWFWVKSLSKLVDDQLEFFNKDREEFLLKEDFKLLTRIEE